nr:hypothetical protein [Tanacetum cinerariifolium]
HKASLTRAMKDGKFGQIID